MGFSEFFEGFLRVCLGLTETVNKGENLHELGKKIPHRLSGRDRTP